ncbi:MAG: hypothetical protein K5872_12060 [Rhizobiaceae bacterium]|nr:hypothetical protein [Rhizobiaceae bacterium]MCV0406950.1 hypothetical protein [Rhizobiaceae bacterium]
MDRNTRQSLIAAAVIFVGFALFAVSLPSIMRAAGEISPFAAGAVVVVFLFGFFAIFWLRGRSRRGPADDIDREGRS